MKPAKLTAGDITVDGHINARADGTATAWSRWSDTLEAALTGAETLEVDGRAWAIEDHRNPAGRNEVLELELRPVSGKAKRPAKAAAAKAEPEDAGPTKAAPGE